ncbi:methyltransferase domain-containing protein [Clostridium sp.]|uniref:class I SAM-dependent methyltransferase n=1 Tax=Clostridium sp. TaxID=1506 RepID=UPI0026354213|nr:methyltransferase domain-containing protein [Clostridium sp.]
MDNKTNNSEHNGSYYDTYGNLYDSNYYESHLGDLPYGDQFWRKGFENIADQIVQQFKPKTFLDVGCAFGYLVAALRDRGVEAYGMDVSEYAISKVREDIKPYCKVCSATEEIPKEFPQKYDLIATIEMIEHLYPEDGDIAIRNICKLSDNIIFSSSPDDEAEETHFNVQPAQYWVKRFLKNGFFNDYNRRPFYISPQCLYFRKTSNIEEVIGDYELAFEKLNENHREEITLIKEDRKKAQEIMDNQARELLCLEENMKIIKEDRKKAQEIMDNQARELFCLNENIEIIKEDRKKAQEIMDSQAKEIQNLKNYISDKEKQYQEVVQSIFWRGTKPIRFICNKIKGK